MKGLLKDGTWVDIKKGCSLTGRRFDKIIIDDVDDFEWINHLRCRLRKDINNRSAIYGFKIFAEQCKALNKAMNSNHDRCKIIPVDNFEFYPLDARLKMVETLNQVVISGDMNLDHVQEAAKKLKKLIKSL